MHEWASIARRNGSGRGNRSFFMDPKDVRVLVIDSKSSSRQNISTLLRDCQYQVTAVKTSKEALGLLRSQAADAQWAFDLILKDHEPPQANACRLLRKLASHEVLRQIPVVVVSTQDERELVARCLSLGAAEYLVKPLRHNELRNIWTKIWWWHKVSSSGALPGSDFTPVGLELGYLASMSQGSSTASEETKCEDEEEPTSKEGSAPDGNGGGHGSNGNGSNGNGSNSGNGNGSKEGNGTSRVEAKVHAGSNNGNGNGSSDNKNGNGNSATKNGHNGSNGNGASTTLLPERPGSGALVGTAEGGLVKPPETGHEEHEPSAKPSMGWGAFTQYTGPISTSRKRPASEVAKEGREEDINSNPPLAEPPTNKPATHRDRTQLRSSVGGGSTPSTHTASEDTTHPSQHPNPALANLRFSRDNAHTTSTVPAFPPHANKLNPGANSSFSAPPTSWPPQFSALAAQAQAQSLSGQNPYQTLPYPYGLSPQMLHSLAFYGSTAAAGHVQQHNPLEGISQQTFPHLPPTDRMMADAATARAITLRAMQAASAQHHNGQRAWENPAPAASLEAIHQQQQQQHQQHMLALYNMSAALYGLQQQSHQQLHSNQPHPSHSVSHSQLHASHHHNAGAQMQPWQLAPQHPSFQHTWSRHVPTQSASNGPQATAPLQSVQIAPLGMMPPQQLPMMPAGSQQQGTPSRALPPMGVAPMEGAIQSSAAGGETGSRSRGVGPRPQSELSRRRAIAIDKYRQKRKNLKFSKTIRYEMRKQLAQNRPRIKGQFVKRTGLDSEDGHGTDECHRPNSANGRSGNLAAGSTGYWQRDEDRTGNSQADSEDEESRGTPFEHDRQGSHQGPAPTSPLEADEEEEEEYDQDEEDEMDEEDMEEEAKEGGSQGGCQEARADDDVEMDVVNSLCELRESTPARPVANLDLEGTNQAHTHCDQSSPTGSHSHRINSPGGSLRVPSSRVASFPFPPRSSQPGAEVHNASINGGRVSSCSALPAVQSASNGNGKNGSDSGSNSPDENGQGEPTMMQGQGARQRILDD